MYSSGGFYPHEIGNSARLDSNSYYTRTPSSAGNRKTWTWSGWVKRSSSGTRQCIFGSVPTSGNTNSNTFQFGFLSDDKFQLGLQTNYVFNSTQVFRDFSAWYHIVVRVDTTQSSASNRIRIYVNGDQITDWAVNRMNDTFIPQNSDLAINNNQNHDIGQFLSSNYFNGYIAEVNHVDGSSLAPTSFGETKADTWIPKAYTGSYGTNGFYLDFATRATDPIDASGNGNNWSSTNVASYDWMLDSPTNNFPTFSPAALDNDRDYLTLLAEGNLRINRGIVSGEGGSIGVPFAVSSGKWYFEAELSEYSGSSSLRFGFNTDTNFNGSGNANKQVSANGLYMIAIDIDNKLYWTGTNGTWDAGDPDAGTGGTSYTSSTDSMVPFVRDNSGSTGNGGTWTVNFGQDSSFAGNQTAQGNTDANGIGDFYYSVPTGHLAICSSNLPDPAIDPALDDVPEDYFNAVLYTGNGSTDRDITGVGFQPDWVWIKKRNATKSHNVFDVLRGAGKMLETNSTIGDFTDTDRLNGFISDGFNLGNDNAVNNSGDTYVAWNWKAGGSGVSNTDGTITSTVSANTDAGFSVVAYTGNGSNNQSVGHGLDKKLDLLILKKRSATSDWIVHTDLIDGSKDYMKLNATDSALTASGNLPSATVFYTAFSGTDNMLAYCFHSVEGFSKFGKYTGNGDADGPFIYTGFRPAFVMIKNASSGTQPWGMYDNRRAGYNEVVNYLMADSSGAEVTSIGGVFYGQLDFVSNGFKIRESDTFLNGSGNTLIYMAFAEMPFKYANAR
jgi:hypothetical protein